MEEKLSPRRRLYDRGLRSSKPADWMATTASSLTLAARCWQVLRANTAFNSSHGIGTTIHWGTDP